jgi:hypothetical protein
LFSFADTIAFVDILFFVLSSNIYCSQSVDSFSDRYKLTDSETEYLSGSETEPTDIDNNFDKLIENIEDIENTERRIDCIYLLANTVYLPEYYLKQIDNFNKSEFTTKDYCNSTTYLLNQIEEQ